MGLVNDLADAVLAKAAPVQYSQPVNWSREWLPERRPEDLTTATATIIPSSTRISLADRDDWQWDVVIQIGLQKKVDQGNLTQEIDDLQTLLEEILNRLRDVALVISGEFTKAWVIEIEQEPLVADEHLREGSVFTTVLRLTYRLVRL